MADLSTKHKLLLYLLSVPTDHSATRKIDPIRIMKTLFVFSQETPKDWLPADAFYSFEPYNYGPCSFTIYDDLSFLETAGLVTSHTPPGQTWKWYEIAPGGESLTIGIKNTLDPRALDYLARLKNYFADLGFAEVLKTVYSRYPEYATNSVFKY